MRTLKFVASSVAMSAVLLSALSLVELDFLDSTAQLYLRISVGLCCIVVGPALFAPWRTWRTEEAAASSMALLFIGLAVSQLLAVGPWSPQYVALASAYAAWLVFARIAGFLMQDYHAR